MANKDKNIEELQKKAAAGDVEAQKNLGIIFELGIGAEENPEEARKYWQKAAESGDHQAQVSIAKILATSDSESDRKEAEKWQAKVDENKSTAFPVVQRPDNIVAGKILVVDHDVASRTSLEICVEKSGFEALTAADGIDGFLKLRCHDDVKLIFMELHTPRQGGLVTLQKIVENSLYRKIPVAIMANKSTKEEVLQAKKLGVNSWFVKPVTQKQVDNLLNQLKLKPPRTAQ